MTKERVLAGLGSSVFFVVAPVTIAGLVPWWIARWHFRPPFVGLESLRIVGVVLIAVGVVVLLESFSRFALQGLGTPAPVYPTRHLVVTGFYRHVRNPMYLAVVSAIVGQALLFGDARLLSYAAIVWLAMHVFVLVYEEPTLRCAFEGEYDLYRSKVPRWLPRMRGWHGEP
jgi:protein-S-isoprenylcysteine O-methyltransferase Ste14